MKVFTKKKSKITFVAVFFCKLVCVDNKFSKPIFVYRGGKPAYRFLESILKEYELCKKVMKKHFNKSLIMAEKEEENSRSINICWICEKLIEDGFDKK